MENKTFSVVEEGGIIAFVELEKDIIKLILSNPKVACSHCGSIMTMNGRCSTCPKCGESSCDV